MGCKMSDWCNTDLLIPLFPPSKAWSVVVSEAQEVVVGHEALYRISHHIYVHWLTLHTVSKRKQKPDVISVYYKHGGGVPQGSTLGNSSFNINMLPLAQL